MKAARVLPNAASAVVQEIEDPALRPGSVIVRIEAAFASHFAAKIVDGSGGYLTPPPPFTPGMDAIGSVESIADGVSGFSIGDRVYCDSYYEPRHPAGTGQRIFIGNFSFGPQAMPLLEAWPDGAYAEKMCLPAECVYPLRPEPAQAGSVLCRLGWLGTAYAALRKVSLAPGAVVAVNGASGLLGSSAVVAALGLGASQVFALGRRKDALDAVAAIDPRVVAATDASAWGLGASTASDTATLATCGLICAATGDPNLTQDAFWCLGRCSTLTRSRKTRQRRSVGAPGDRVNA